MKKLGAWFQIRDPLVGIDTAPSALRHALRAEVLDGIAMSPRPNPLPGPKTCARALWTHRTHLCVSKKKQTKEAIGERRLRHMRNAGSTNVDCERRKVCASPQANTTQEQALPQFLSRKCAARLPTRTVGLCQQRLTRFVSTTPAPTPPVSRAKPTQAYTPLNWER